MTGKPRFGALTILIGLCMACLAGCSRTYEGPQRVSVAGQVTFDGEPVDGGVINLSPVSGDLRKVSGLIEKGRFAIPEEKGPNVGKYKVEIMWPKPTGKKIGRGEDATDETMEAIPAKYNAQTTLEVDIAAKVDNLDFALTAK